MTLKSLMTLVNVVLNGIKYYGEQNYIMNAATICVKNLTLMTKDLIYKDLIFFRFHILICILSGTSVLPMFYMHAHENTLATLQPADGRTTSIYQNSRNTVKTTCTQFKFCTVKITYMLNAEIIEIWKTYGSNSLCDMLYDLDIPASTENGFGF